MAKQRLKLPMQFEEAVADLLKVKPPEKGEPKKATRTSKKRNKKR